MRDSGWNGNVLPTFRPDTVVNIDTKGWRQHIEQLGKIAGQDINNYQTLITALENRRAFFKSMGAKATDHAALTPYTNELSVQEADAIFQRALKGNALPEDAAQFTGHMLMEMARMSVEDGLVMQLHPGSFRNHNQQIFERFGPDKGADIPVPIEYTRNLHPLLNKYGTNPQFSMILFRVRRDCVQSRYGPTGGSLSRA